MIFKHNLYKIALVSIAITLMLVSTAAAARYGDGNVILKTDPCTGFVDFLKFPACGFGDIILETDPCTGFVDFLKFPSCGCGCGNNC